MEPHRLDFTESEEDSAPNNGALQMEVDEVSHQLASLLTEPTHAFRTKSNKHDPATCLRDYSELIQRLIKQLTNFTKTQSKGFYRKEEA